MCFKIWVGTIWWILDCIMMLNWYMSTIKRLLKFFHITCINQNGSLYFRRPLISAENMTNLIIHNWWDMMPSVWIRVESEQVLLQTAVSLKWWHLSQNDLVSTQHIVINICIVVAWSTNETLKLRAALSIMSASILTFKQTLLAFINMNL